MIAHRRGTGTGNGYAPSPIMSAASQRNKPKDQPNVSDAAKQCSRLHTRTEEPYKWFIDVV